MIVSKINDNCTGLNRLIETSLPNFTVERFEQWLISEGIRDKSLPDNILKKGMDWINDLLAIDEYYEKFLKVCDK